jgi:hypothetical protein
MSRRRSLTGEEPGLHRARSEEETDLNIRRLMVEILSQAVADFRAARDGRKRRPILDWFRDGSDAYVFSCASICMHLGLSQQRIVKQLQEENLARRAEAAARSPRGHTSR